MEAVARVFLLVTAVGFLLVYALPLLLVPLTWARVFRWHVAAVADPLTVYLGRCLGAVAVGVLFVVARAAMAPRDHRDVFMLLALIGVLMIAIHGWGALRRAQPWTETAEIGLYALVTGASLWLGQGLG